MTTDQPSMMLPFSEQPVDPAQVPIPEKPSVENGPSGPEVEEISGSSELPTSESMLRLLVSKQRLEKLWSRAEKLQSEVNRSVNKLQVASELLTKVENARSLILSGRDRYEEADHLLSEVEHRLALSERVAAASRSVGMPLFLYEVVLFVLLSVAFYLVNLTPLLANVYLAPPLDHFSVLQFLNSVIWGSFGGIVGALYALWKHIGEDQDFDKQYAIWYVTNPILGLALGAFVFLVIQAGFLSLTAGANGDVIRSASVIYVLAWIAGFKQNVVYEMVHRILDVFRINTTVDEKAETSPKPATNMKTGQPQG